MIWSISGCDRKIYSRKGSPDGLCGRHHHCWRRFGDATAGPREILLDNCDRSGGPDSCWMWTGGTVPQGYGVFHVDGVATRAHITAWEFDNGPVPEGMEIDHRCLRMGCVNPRHLRLATTKQNRENRQGAQSNSHTGIRGVTRLGPNRWRARVRHNKKTIYLGNYPTAEIAAEVARLKRIELFTHNEIDRLVDA
jgi:hypothetical protein